MKYLSTNSKIGDWQDVEICGRISIDGDAQVSDLGN